MTTHRKRMGLLLKPSRFRLSSPSPRGFGNISLTLEQKISSIYNPSVPLHLNASYPRGYSTATRAMAKFEARTAWPRRWKLYIFAFPPHPRHSTPFCHRPARRLAPSRQCRSSRAARIEGRVSYRLEVLDADCSFRSSCCGDDTRWR